MELEAAIEGFNAVIGIGGFMVALFALNKFKSKTIRRFIFLLALAMLIIGVKELFGLYQILSDEGRLAYHALEAASLIVLTAALIYGYQSTRFIELQ